MNFFFARGYYPKGGGEIHVTVKPVKQLKPLQLLERGSLVRITGCAFVAGVLPFKVCRHAVHYYETKTVCTPEMNTKFTTINIYGLKSESSIITIATSLILGIHVMVN